MTAAQHSGSSIVGFSRAADIIGNFIGYFINFSFRIKNKWFRRDFSRNLLYVNVNKCCICEQDRHIPITGSNMTGTETHSLNQGWTLDMTATKKAAAPKTEAKEAGILNADITKGAREYVARTAASVKERNDSAYEGVTKLNSGIEKTMSRFVGGYVGMMGEMAKAAHDDMAKALTTVEKDRSRQIVHRSRADTGRLLPRHTRQPTTTAHRLLSPLAVTWSTKASKQSAKAHQTCCLSPKKPPKSGHRSRTRL